MTPSSLVNSCTRRPAAPPLLLALVIAHQTEISPPRARRPPATRTARAASRAGDALARALIELERLQLPARTARAAERSDGQPLAVPGTVTPAERAWVLAWHLLTATARIHSRAFAAGRPKFGERETANAVDCTRDALRELEPLLTPRRRDELRAVSLPPRSHWTRRLRLFDPLLPSPAPSAGERARPYRGPRRLVTRVCASEAAALRPEVR